MKKTIMLILAGLILLNPLRAETDDDRPITIEELPSEARNFISLHFPGERVALALMERDFPDIDYKVVFATGAMAEFDRQGLWTEISCRYSEMPAGIVPEPMEAKAAELYPDSRVTEIERGRKGYELKLDNGMELTFGTDFRLLDIDD